MPPQLAHWVSVVQLIGGDEGKHPVVEELVHANVTPLQLTDPAAALQLVPLHDLATPSNGAAQFVDALQLNTGDVGAGLMATFSDVALTCRSFPGTAHPPLTTIMIIHNNVYTRTLCSFWARMVPAYISGLITVPHTCLVVSEAPLDLAFLKKKNIAYISRHAAH